MRYAAFSLTIALAFPVSANAATLVLAGPAAPYDEMIQNNGTADATNITLATLPSGYLVSLTSGDVLSPSGNGGFAQIDGPFSALVLDPLSPLAGFNALQFTLNPAGPNNVDYSFEMLVHFVGGGTQLFTTDFSTNNKFDLLADSGQVISSVSFSNLLGQTSKQDSTLIPYNFADIRQISFNGVLDTGVPSPEAAVPEPSTWAFMLLGFGAIGFGLRRRKKSQLRVRYQQA